MRKALVNYAFIDGQNLNLSIQAMGWKLHFSRFRIYLREKYGVEIAYYFIGYVDGNSELYRALQIAGYILVFKPTFRNAVGNVKGNCDAECVHRSERAVVPVGIEPIFRNCGNHPSGGESHLNWKTDIQ
ncbi:MAG: hypothetical protein JXA46_14575 [Dehalococcoidales bacterium]|nr:hypothetical protein [Dehalococcoidales bacterium]